MKQTRWMFAHLDVLGTVCFETEDAMGHGHIRATKLCAVRIKVDKDGHVVDQSVSRMSGYQIGFLQDPVFIGESAVIVVCIAPDDMAEAARRAWSNIAIANRLPDNGRFGK